MTTTTRPDRVQLSRRVAEAVRDSPFPQYKIARLIDARRGTLASWLAGINRPQRDDPRLARLARLVGLRESELFEDEEGRPSAG